MNVQPVRKKEIKYIYLMYCIKCEKEIKGTSVSQVNYNTKLHFDKCLKIDPLTSNIRNIRKSI